MPGSGLSLLVCSSVHPKYFEIDKFDCAIPDDVLQQVMWFLAEEATKSGARGLTVNKFQEYVNQVLIPKLMKDPDFVTLLVRTLICEEGTITHPIALAWMK